MQFTRVSHLPIQAVPAEAELTRAGKLSHYTLHYPSIDHQLRISFDRAFPHIIRRWEERSSASGHSGGIDPPLDAERALLAAKPSCRHTAAQTTGS